MVIDSLLIQDTPYWVNENLYNQLNEEIIQNRDNIKNIIKENESDIVSMRS